MLPPLNDNGYLPEGTHRCTIEELGERFGSGSDEREVQFAELSAFVSEAWVAGIRRILVNGSFVTGKLAPNDVDIVVLPGPDYPRTSRPLDDDELLWPFLQIYFASDDDDFEAWAARQFGTDRRRRPKGVVEIENVGTSDS